MMKKLFLSLLVCIVLSSCEHELPITVPSKALTRTLVFSRTAGFRHESIEAGQQMFRERAEAWGLSVRTSEALLSVTELDSCDLLVLLSNTGDVFDSTEQVALKGYVQGGGAVLAIHAATDAEYSWPWYNQMLGAWFDNHPAIQQANCLLTDPDHAAGKDMPTTWTRADEWYNFKDMQPGIQVVYRLDESSYSGGTNGSYHPICWYHSFDGGRIFYTGMGHTSETYSENFFLKHIEGAINWLRAE
jgi:type 1 glutamine amidotransferase